jgi:hypothetical protein
LQCPAPRWSVSSRTRPLCDVTVGT